MLNYIGGISTYGIKTLEIIQKVVFNDADKTNHTILMEINSKDTNCKQKMISTI